MKSSIIKGVIGMNLLNSITVTHIDPPVTVHSEKGRVFDMVDRPAFGLSLCISGQITYTINGRRYVSEPGSAVLLPQNGSYSLYGDKEGLFPLINFRCEHFPFREIFVFPLQNPAACLKDFEALKQLFLFKGNRLQRYSTFYELLNKISAPRLPDRNPLHPAMPYIEQHLSDPELSNNLLAREMGISEVYLRKLFSVHYQTTPKQFILDLRIRKAKQLLTDTALSVTVIAGECGFSSVYHFCRLFKIKVGQTPSEYKKANTVFKI